MNVLGDKNETIQFSIEGKRKLKRNRREKALKKELRTIGEWRDELEREGKLISIEETSGIYLIRMPDNFKIDIRPSTDAIDVYKERSMLYGMERLKDKWKTICHGEVDNKIVYIGKADRNSKTKRNLRKRVTELIKYGYGECNNHRGGRAIWQLENNKELLLEVIQCENPREKEREFLINYHNKCGEYPFANFKK